jgi:hypothetical protein
MEEVLLPPDDPGDADLASVEWKTEYHVLQALRALGHDVKSQGVGTDLGVIRAAIEDFGPDVVFNLLEDFEDVPIFDQNVVAYLELLGVPYTGCNSRGLMLARDKALAKKLLAFHRIPVPEFHVFRMGRAVVRPKWLAFPLIVKSLTKEGSAGISKLSVVDSDQKLKERVALIHKRQHTDAIVERYVDAAEALRRRHRRAPPPGPADMGDGVPDAGAPRTTERVKWDPPTRRSTASTRTGEGLERIDGDADPEHLPAGLPHARALGLCAHRPPPRRRGPARPPGESRESESPTTGLRRRGEAHQHDVPRADPASGQPRARGSRGDRRVAARGRPACVASPHRATWLVSSSARRRLLSVRKRRLRRRGGACTAIASS